MQQMMPGRATDLDRVVPDDDVLPEFREPLIQPPWRVREIESGQQVEVLVKHDAVAVSSGEVETQRDVVNVRSPLEHAGRARPSPFPELRHQLAEAGLAVHGEDQDRLTRVGVERRHRLLRDGPDQLEVPRPGVPGRRRRC